MKVNKRKNWGLLLLSLCLLAGCQVVPQQENKESKEEISEQNTGGRLSRAYYSALSQEGRYDINNIRGIVATSTSQANLRQFEKGLYDLAREQFSTDDYLFREGSVIDRKMANRWLGTKSSDNPDGLNPKEARATKREDFKPKYLNSILEYDLLTHSDNGQSRLAGISIGLAMNSQVTFSNDEGQELVEIDEETAVSEGKKMATEIIARIRANNPTYGKIPIQVAIFYSAPLDNIAGGAYKSEGISVAGSSFSDWRNINIEHKVLGLGEDPSDEVSVGFSRFREEVEDYFPQLSGIQGIGTYQDGQLIRLDIKITSQFDGYSETIALVQQAIKEANTIFRNNNGEVSMTIQGPAGIHALMNRPSGETTFTYDIIE